VVGRQIHGRKSGSLLIAQCLWLSPHLGSVNTDVCGIAVEEGDPEHGIANLQACDRSSNSLHMAGVLEARRDGPPYEPARRLVDS
jgi:hypothetical protein